jgi:hypothetical protein
MSNLKAIHEATRLQPINKLMVVGHPLSGYASVEQVLHGSGLHAAAASKTQGLSPTQVSDMLLRAYRVQPLNELQALDNFKPINPSPVWQTLALDLLLGNLEQELWGWADPQAIYLLDYWKNLDHQLAFVLVYDSPQASMASLFDNPEVDCNEHVVKAASDNWLAYNEALLNFYLGNTERCLLVHGQQVRAKTADCLRQVQHQMGVVLNMPFADGVQTSGSAASSAYPSSSSASHPSSSAWLAMQTQLCARVISANPKVGQMYTDLQSVASLPMGSAMDKPSFDTDMAVLSKFVALHRSNLKIQQVVEELKAAKEAQAQALNQRLAELVQSYEHSQAHGHALEHEKQQLFALAEDRLRSIEELRQREVELQGRVNELAVQLQQARDEVNQHAAVAAADYVKSNKALEEENKMIINELFQVQQQLEQCYLENKNLKDGSKYPKLRGAGELIKNSFTYQLGATVVSSKESTMGFIKLPYKLLKKYIEYKGKKVKSNEAINLLENYIDIEEGNKYKKHLSFKFGEVFIKTGINPIDWFMLPARLNKTYINWSLEKQAVKK